MNILNTTIIFAILLKCATACRGGTDAFKWSVENNDLDAAVKIFQGEGVSFQTYRIKYAIQRGVPDFIVGFIKGVKLTDKAALIAIFSDCPLDVMKQIVEQVDFPKVNLPSAASEPSVFCSREKISYLFGKMDHHELRRIIPLGIMKLFRHNRTDSLPMILKLLQRQMSSDSDLHDVVIQTIFVEAAAAHSDEWIDYCEWHPAIDDITYGNALVYAWKANPHSPFFKRLLGKASRDDLEAALGDSRDRQIGEFYAAIRSVPFKADFECNRNNPHVVTAWVSRKILDEDVNIGMPEVITDTIISYITEWRLPSRKSVTKDKNVGGEMIGVQHERVILPNAQFLELLEGLVNEGHYETLRKICMTLNVSQVSKYIYPLITKMEHYKEFYEFLRKYELLRYFFVHVLGAIGREMEKAELAAGKKITDLFQIIEFMIDDVALGEWIPAIKRFLVMHGNELGKRHLNIYQKFCEGLGRKVGSSLGKSWGRAFLIDLARQPITLPLNAFFKGFEAADSYITYYLNDLNWRECMSAYLFDDEERGRVRWEILTREYPAKYAGGYPSTNETRKAFLRQFKSKQEWEEEWRKEEQEKLTIVLERLEQILDFFPKVSLPIIAIYAVEWI